MSDLDALIATLENPSPEQIRANINRNPSDLQSGDFGMLIEQAGFQGPQGFEVKQQTEPEDVDVDDLVKAAEEALKQKIVADAGISGRSKTAVLETLKGVTDVVAGITGATEDLGERIVTETTLALGNAFGVPPETWTDTNDVEPLAKDVAEFSMASEIRAAADKYLSTDPVLAQTLESQIGRALGQTAALGATFAVNPMLGVASTSGFSAGEMYRRAKEGGATDNQALIAAGYGIPIGLLDLIPITRVFGRLDRASGGAFKRGLIKFITEVGTGGLEEGAQEVVQTLAESKVLESVGVEEKNLLEDLQQAGKIGGFVGILMNAAAMAAGVRMRGRGREQVSETAVDERDPTGLAAQLEEQAEPEFKIGDTVITRQQAEAVSGESPTRSAYERAGLSDLTKSGQPAAERKQRAEIGKSLRDQIQEADRAGAIREDQGVVQEEGVLGQEGQRAGGPDLQQAQETERPAAAPQEGSPEEIAHQGPSVTSIKNAVVDQERLARGLPPAMQTARRSFGTIWDEAMQIAETDPIKQDALIAELAEKPRAVEDWEDALLLHRQITLQNQYDKNLAEIEQAEQSGDEAQLADLQHNEELLSQRLLELYDINKAVGTATSRGLLARKMMANHDFTLAKMLYMKRKAIGAAQLTEEESASVREAHKKIADLERQLNEYTARIEELEAERVADEAVIDIEKRTRKGKGKRSVAARADVAAAWKELEDTLSGKLFANPIDPEILAGMTKLARAYVRLGVAKVEDFISNVVARIGQERAERLDDAIRASWKSAIAEEKPQPTKELEDGAAISRFANKLAEFFVRQGITERNALIDAVHAELVQAIPDITRRQTMDAISGYGQFSALSKDDLKRQLRDLRGQMQQVAKLEDMQAGQAPLKTGRERRTPSDEERRLIAQVNEMKKKGGFTVTDPTRQLRTALDAIKRRLTNQISDLEEQIRTRTKIVRDRKSTPLDEEAEALTKRRDALRKQFDEIFGNRELTDEQRIRQAMAATRKSINEYKRRIADRDISPKKRVSKTPQTPELMALKAERDALRAEFDHMKKLLTPKMSPDEKALSAVKANLRRRIADYQRRLAESDFAPKKPKPVKPDEEVEKLRFEAEKARAEFLKGLDADRRSRMTRVEKVFEGGREILRLSRSIITSLDLSAIFRQGGWVAYGHPSALKNTSEALRAFGSEAAESRIMNEISNRENAALYQRAGLSLTGIHGKLSDQEEAYMSRWSQSVPLISGSERAYVAYLNLIRADLFDSMVASLGRNGSVSDADAKVIANYVNVATGRAGVGYLQRYAVGMADVFFAPRYVASRFQLLLGQPLMAGGSAKVKLLIAKEYARSLSGLGLVLGSAATAMWALIGPPGEDNEWNIELDPRSSDFGKIRIGNTRIDFLVGLSQSTVLISRLVSGKRKSIKGDLIPIRGKDVPYGSGDSADVIARFMRSKLAPIPGQVINVLAGKTFVGEPTTPKTIVRDLSIPLSFRDIKDAMNDQGVPGGTILGLMSIMGVSIQTFEQRSRTQRLIDDFRAEGAESKDDIRKAFGKYWRGRGYKIGSDAYWQNWRTIVKELENEQ